MLMEKNERFNHLLSRYLKKETSQEEYDQLMDLIRKGASDEFLKERIAAEMDDSARDNDMTAERAREILSQITQKAPAKVIPLRRQRIWQWAAAAVVLISV